MDPNPAIVSPVSRSIAIADPTRSTLFYRDILGFEIRNQSGVMHAICGPADIIFDPQEAIPEPSMLFFETADLAATHAAIRARGGTPSALEKVNWIKMRMFEIGDPNGHTLWFGQSYDVPVKPIAAPMMRKALPELPFDDVAAAVAYYWDVLGFHINYQQHDLGVMDRDNITLLLIARTPHHTGIGSAYFYVSNADALHAELRSRGADLQGEPVSHPWGLRDFRAVDLEGNWLTFGQTFE